MMISSGTKGNFHAVDPDVQLLIKLNGILKLFEKYEFDNDITFIKTEFYTVRSAFLTACVNETKDYFHRTSAKNEIRLEVEARIIQFEELIKTEPFEIMQAYHQHCLN